MKIWIIIFLSNLLLINCQLYTKNDKITIFQTQSFNDVFKNKPSENWIIQFYHSYCGHCINFAPLFKIFMLEANKWNKVIRFGVVDCSEHKGLCSDQGVNFYPYFKFYLNKSYNNSSSMGENFKSPRDTLEDLHRGVIEQIEITLHPKILIETRNVTEKKYFLISSGNTANLKRTMLTFSDRLLYPIFYQYEAGRLDYEAEMFNGTNSLVYRATDMDDLYKWLSQYLNDNPYPKVEMITKSLAFQRNKNLSVVIPPVYNQDIYSSIYYAFTNDISDSVLNDISNVRILRKFVNKLFLFSDISETFTANFKHLADLLDKKIDTMNLQSKFVMKWADMLRLSQFPEIEPTWIGCNGSLPHLRRYPCGLWTMFHSLTVSHHIKVTSHEIKDDSLDLISSIREFIVTFFACRECAENFKRETAKYEQQVQNSSDAVIFIWKVHNSVNKRLAKAPSDDPFFPKQAFPSQSACPNCRLKQNTIWPKIDHWSLPDVLNFLIEHYSNINRVQFLTEPVLLLKTSPSWFLVGPSSIDISICVILSILCSFIVFLAFMKFWFKSTICSVRKYRRTQLSA